MNIVEARKIIVGYPPATDKYRKVRMITGAMMNNREINPKLYKPFSDKEKEAIHKYVSHLIEEKAARDARED